MDLGIPIPTIDAAVTMRGLSALKARREEAAQHFGAIALRMPPVNRDVFVDQVGHALHFAFIITYAQGMHLLAEASKEYKYELNMEVVARIWRGGCIIRAALLEEMRKAYDEQPDLDNLLMAPVFQSTLEQEQTSARSVLALALQYGRPTMAMTSALNYFDAYRTARLPLNLVQAQRDYFGSHTYERVDKEGIFHTEWE